MSAPILRHQTGETVGEKHFRFTSHFEMSRIYTPGVASNLAVANVSQGNSVFQGGLFGVEAQAGVLPTLDLLLGANFTASGGGWHAGAMYQFVRTGKLGVAVLGGYGTGSGSGDVTYLTSSTPETVNLTLSAWTVDLSVPVSFRISTPVWVYGGPLMVFSSLNGVAGTTAIHSTYFDPGMNLGVRIQSGIFLGDIEAAEVLVGDPFVGGSRFIPYVGLSFGVVL